MQATNENTGKPVGMEKLVVRIFRDACARALLSSGQLKPTLDEFLRAVLTNTSASKSDKDYARKVYKDLIAMTGGSGLPVWVRKEDEAKVQAAKDVDAILGDLGVEPSKAAVEEGSFEDTELDELDKLLRSVDVAKEDPFLSADSPLRKFLAELVAKFRHPPIMTFHLEGQRYVALGTLFGRVRDDIHLNINCTVNPYQSLAKVPADIMVYNGNRPLNVMDEDAHGLRRYVYCCRHVTGRKIRYWMRKNDEDQPSGARFVILTDDEQGYKVVTRNEF